MDAQLITSKAVPALGDAFTVVPQVSFELLPFYLNVEALRALNFGFTTLLLLVIIDVVEFQCMTTTLDALNNSLRTVVL